MAGLAGTIILTVFYASWKRWLNLNPLTSGLSCSVTPKWLLQPYDNTVWVLDSEMDCASPKHKYVCIWSCLPDLTPCEIQQNSPGAMVGVTCHPLQFAHNQPDQSHRVMFGSLKLPKQYDRAWQWLYFSTPKIFHLWWAILPNAISQPGRCLETTWLQLCGVTRSAKYWSKWSKSGVCKLANIINIIC